jgi:formylglycine-generating enzyme required for sulfatase activity
MLIALKMKLAVAMVCASGPVAVSMLASGQAAGDGAIKPPAMVELQPHAFRYQPAGEFSRHGRPVSAPARMTQQNEPLAIMRHQVTAADYRLCVRDKACAPAADVGADPNLPAVNVSWRDAQAYAAWLSHRLGVTYRLPTDHEWAFAAGSRFRDDVLPDGGSDPAQRWLARYEQEAAREAPADKQPRPLGSFGVNEHGIADLAGNVWEWTDSCFARQALDDTGSPAAAPLVNCGVRVVEGQHRTYVTDFIRDARAGGCAVGVPPSNLGFRLVRQDDTWRGKVHRLMARLGLAV